MNSFVGVISDTHSLIRPKALAVLSGADLIIHAGDIGSPEVIDALQGIAPLVIIKGNVDKGPWADSIPETSAVEILGKHAYVLHSLKDLDLEPAGQFDVVIFGHSHKPHNELKAGVLYFNPGSAGPRRFKLPVAVGKLTMDEGVLCGEIIELDV